MQLTVVYLKKVLERLDDDVIIAHLGECSNSSFEPFMGVKRLILLEPKDEKKGWGKRKFLAINSMGTHFTGNGDQASFKATDHFD